MSSVNLTLFVNHYGLTWFRFIFMGQALLQKRDSSGTVYPAYCGGAVHLIAAFICKIYFLQT